MYSKKIPEKINKKPRWSFLNNLLPEDHDIFEDEAVMYAQVLLPLSTVEKEKITEKQEQLQKVINDSNPAGKKKSATVIDVNSVNLDKLNDENFNFQALDEHFRNRNILIESAIPKLEKRIHDISALLGNDMCDISRRKSVVFYTSGHGELINQQEEGDLLVPTLESAANEYFGDDNTRKELFFKYLLTIKYSSAASPGIEADMISVDKMSRLYTCDTSSENNNLVSLFSNYADEETNSNELFDRTRIELRKTNPAYLKGTLTLDGIDFFNVDPEEFNTGDGDSETPKYKAIKNFFQAKPYADHHSEYDRIQFEQGNIPYQRYIIDKLTPNKNIYFGPNSRERKDMHCFYGLQILKFFNIGLPFDDRFNHDPADRSFIDKNKQFILEMFLRKNIELSEKLADSINKVFSNIGKPNNHPIKRLDYGKPLDCASLFDIYIIFFELGIFVDHFDPSCATSLYKENAKLGLVPLRSNVEIMEKYFPQQLLEENDQFLQLVLPSFIPRLDAIISRCVVDNGNDVARPSAVVDVARPSAAVDVVESSAVIVPEKKSRAKKKLGGNLTRRSKRKRNRKRSKRV